MILIKILKKYLIKTLVPKWCCDIHDLKESEIPKFDIMTSGFPCQPFSIAGNQNGLEDERSDVFLNYKDN